MKKFMLILYVITISLMGYSQHTLVLNPVSDCYVVTYGGGMGKNSFLKFNITSLPAGAVLTATKLRTFVTNTSLAWDGDLRIIHYSNQTWVEGDSNKVLWQLAYLADTMVQLSGYGSTLGWAETMDIKTYLNVDFQAPHTFFSLILKDVDDPTMAPNMSGVSVNDNDSMMIGNIFSDNIVFRPREWVNAPPQLVIDYGIPPTIQPLSPISPVCQGSTVILSIIATGDPTLLYQWKFNGVDITGANSSSYTIPSAQVSNTGNYTCVVTNTYGTATSGIITLTVNSNPTINITSTNISCNGLCNGSATVSTSGGTSPYTYLWSNLSTTPTITNLCPGTYSPTIIDSQGCSATGSVTISQPLPILVTQTHTNVTCSGLCNGTATLNISGGTPAYNILWSNMAIGNPITGLCAGVYCCTITDVNGCTANTCVTITQPAALSVSVSTINVSCFGLCDGSASFNVTGGTTPYSYLWSNGAMGNPITGLCAGTYYGTITDASGCNVTTSFTITQPANLILTNTQTNVTCFGLCNGTATVNASGGTPGYTYMWGANTGWQTTSTATLLCAGVYYCTVMDSNLCSSVTSVTITQPSQILISIISTNITCAGLCNGEITAIVTGGVPPYQYSWNTGVISNTITGLCAGSYGLTITDANGCSTVTTIILSEPIPLVDFISSTDDYGTGNGTATIVVTGGIPSYTYLWDDPASQITSTANNLVAGLYHVTATDANGCVKIDSVEVLLNTNISTQIYEFNFNIFPNPVKSELFLNITTSKSENISIVIYNSIGNIIVSKGISLSAGNNLQSFDMKQISSGVYFIKILGSENSVSLKFIKTE